MTIDPKILFGLCLASFIPFIVLGITSHVTRAFRRKVHRGEVDLVNQPLSLLVRLHGATIRSVPRSLLANLEATAIFFGFPLLVIAAWWPQEVVGTFETMRLWIVLWICMSLLRVCYTSPDSTGGLDEAMSPGLKDNHLEPKSTE